MLFNVQHIGRNRMVPRTVGFALAADEQNAEGQLRQPEDQLIDPTGNTATDIGPGTFKQKADIRYRSGRRGITHNQYLAGAAKGGRLSMSLGSPARCFGTSAKRRWQKAISALKGSSCSNDT